MITLEKFFEALNQVEAGGRKKHVPVGDNGISIGPLQISEIYFQDADEWLIQKGIYIKPLVNLSDWSGCEDWEFSKIIVYAYFQRYAPKALREGNWELLARVHNGGPRGHLKKATLPYWEKVKAELEKMERMDIPKAKPFKK